MKNFLCASLMLATAVAFAAADDTVVTFSTKGPDRYADGTVVKDGEYYALVYAQEGATVTFNADGSLAGSGATKIVAVPLAKGGKCPTTLFQLPASVTRGLQGGAYALYLLDTRRADGSLAGNAAVVNGYDAIATFAKGAGSFESKEGEQATDATTGKPATFAQSAVPADAPKATVKSVKIADGWATITVGNTAPYLQYGVNAGSEPGALVQAEGKKQGNGGEITIVTPATGAVGFYQVDRAK